MESSVMVFAVIGALLLAGILVYLVRRARLQRPTLPAEPGEKREPGKAPTLPDVSAPIAPPIAGPVATSPVQGLGLRLAKTRGVFLGGLSAFWGRSQSESLKSQEWDQLEEALLAADVGVATTERLLQGVKRRMEQTAGRNLRELIEEEGLALFAGAEHGDLIFHERPLVISVVGVNGAGKTTTIGKLAQRLANDGHSVLLGAGDTFRAAAISQLRIWAERTHSQLVTGREGADPGAVAFDAVTAGKARGVDVVLVDTAGRLHTKTNLMDELKKVHRVMKKVIPEAPHQVWLVLDGTAGQNSIQQAREFQKALDVTGVIITKLDGTAKGGAVLAVASELKLPIRYIGVGEQAEDLVPFNPGPFIEAILGAPSENGVTP